MKCSVAAWLYVRDGKPLPHLVNEFADLGFDAVSFRCETIMNVDAAVRRDVSAVMAERGLTATVHTHGGMTDEGLDAVVDTFGERLYSITMDADKVNDSRGRFVDASATVAVLERIEKATRGTSVWFGAEDFPRDALALAYYRDDLAPLLNCPRFGLLVDVGHMNLHLRSLKYYRGVTPEEYFARLPLPLIELHLHDNDGTRDQHRYFGSGNNDFAAVARGVRAIGFDGVATIEAVPEWCDLTPDEAMPHAKASLDAWRAELGG
jgi:sugar phosphate isomerase/epimerase